MYAKVYSKILEITSLRHWVW